MKKTIALICMILLSLNFLFANNLQKVYTTRDSVYKRIEALCNRAGVIGPSSFSPMSANTLINALERINQSELSEFDKKEYQELYTELTCENYIFKSENFYVDITPGINLGVNIADYKDFDYGNTNSETPMPNRKENTLVPYRYEDALLSVGLNMAFGDHIYLDSHFDLKNPNHVMFESSLGFLFTSTTENKGIAAEWPHRAGASIGNDYISFIFGRFPHSVGSGVTGNLIIGDNFDYQEIAVLSLMSNYFSYNISITRFDQQDIYENHGFLRNKFSGDQQVRVLHRFDINIVNKARIVLNLATLYNASSFFDLRFFYPFMLSHNYYDYTNGIGKSSFDEANNILSIEAEWNIIKGLTASAQIAVDQFQMPWEKYTDLPIAFGVLGNLKYSTKVGKGTLNSWFEAVYTNPYLYLNAKYFSEMAGDKVINLIDYNLDYIVGYHSNYFDDYGYSGYVYGPDSIVFSIGTAYTEDEGKFEIGGNILYKISGTKGVRHYVKSAHNTIIDMSNAVIEEKPEDFMSNTITPSGGWKTAEHLLKLALYGNYNFEEYSWGNVKLYTAAGFNTYFNYNHNIGQTEFQPQWMFGVEYTY